MSSRESSVDRILEGLNNSRITESRIYEDIGDDNLIASLQKDINKYSRDTKVLSIFDREPNMTYYALQDKKSKNYFTFVKGDGGYTTSIHLVETPESRKYLASYYMNGLNDYEGIVNFVVKCHDAKKYFKSLSNIKSELSKVYKEYSIMKSIDSDWSFLLFNDANKSLMKHLDNMFNDRFKDGFFKN